MLDENDERLDSCGVHDFQPVVSNSDKSVSLYRCLGCGGMVSAVDGLRYMLTGSLDETN